MMSACLEFSLQSGVDGGTEEINLAGFRLHLFPDPGEDPVLLSLGEKSFLTSHSAVGPGVTLCCPCMLLHR